MWPTIVCVIEEVEKDYNIIKVDYNIPDYHPEVSSEPAEPAEVSLLSSLGPINVKS